jgi:hypothetical protein
VNTRGIAGTGCGYGAVCKVAHRTRTRATRFGNTAGLPAPVANPNLLERGTYDVLFLVDTPWYEIGANRLLGKEQDEYVINGTVNNGAY